MYLTDLEIEKYLKESPYNYLENNTDIFYSKNRENQFRNMYTHFKKGW